MKYLLWLLTIPHLFASPESDFTHHQKKELIYWNKFYGPQDQKLMIWADEQNHQYSLYLKSSQEKKVHTLHQEADMAHSLKSVSYIEDLKGGTFVTIWGHGVHGSSAKLYSIKGQLIWEKNFPWPVDYQAKDNTLEWSWLDHGKEKKILAP